MTVSCVFDQSPALENQVLFEQGSLSISISKMSDSIFLYFYPKEYPNERVVIASGDDNDELVKFKTRLEARITEFQASEKCIKMREVDELIKQAKVECTTALLDKLNTLKSFMTDEQKDAVQKFRRRR
jgi:hypothetical protein